MNRQNLASLNYIEDFADLKRFAESGDCDVPSWVSSNILSALDVIEKLREQILTAPVADSGEGSSSTKDKGSKCD